jgi:hypothetical protein
MMGGETRELEGNAQLGLGFEAAATAAREQLAAEPGEERFVSAAEGEFYLGAQRLDEYLCATQQGWVVLDMDYRASAGYGRDWRTAIYRQMGRTNEAKREFDTGERFGAAQQLAEKSFRARLIVALHARIEPDVEDFNRAAVAAPMPLAPPVIRTRFASKPRTRASRK